MTEFLNSGVQTSALASSPKKFKVTVRTIDDSISYETDGIDSATAHIAAVSIFGACGVTVMPVQIATA